MNEKNISYIPAGVPFAKTITKKIISDYQGHMHDIADIKILLPTRRACRIIEENFIKHSKGRAIILPNIKTIGDIDEHYFIKDSVHQDIQKQISAIKPAINPLKRQILLARLITKIETFDQNFEQALKLSSALSQFLDQIYTEDLTMDALQNIVPEDFASHWQVTLKFFEILSSAWPKILEEQNEIDEADRRNQFIKLLNQHWQESAPNSHIIAAGTTGSIPAVANLLSTIAMQKNGQVILPGLDPYIDEKSWNALDETHPQFGFKHLLSTIKCDAKSVKPYINENTQTPRQILIREAMRPFETTHQWNDLQNNDHTITTFNQALNNFKIIPCDHENDEANIIALIIREALEKPHNKVTIITPDRSLAKRIKTSAKKWNIDIDDSAGSPLDTTPLGQYMMQIIKVAEKNYAPVALLSLLKNQKSKILNTEDIHELEEKLLRGYKTKPGLEHLKNKALNKEFTHHLIEKLHIIDENLSPLIQMGEGTHKVEKLLKTHIEIAEHSAGGADKIWCAQEAKTLIDALQNILKNAHHFPEVSLKQYATIFKQILQSETFREKNKRNNTIQILGQLEARMIDADLVIMAGLIEGTWPPDPGQDPWMSRPMRKNAGLPIYERSIGLAAHDFVQGFCADKVFITYAHKKEGTQTIPSRWIQRLYTVLDAAHTNHTLHNMTPYKYWSNIIENTENPTCPIKRPAPKPALDKRPKKLSSTRIDILMRDPYSIYVRYILNIKKLDPLEKDLDAAALGTIIHETLHEFMNQYPKSMPDGPHEKIMAIAEKKLNALTDNAQQQFWLNKIKNLAHWFINHEAQWRKNGASYLKGEIDGAMTIDNVTIHARADRIDKTPSGLAIIDYKTGGQFTKKSIESGHSPQLPVEGIIAAHAGYKSINHKTISELSYWMLTGNQSKPGEVKSITKNINTILENTEEGLKVLIRQFNDEDTSYYALPNANFLPRFNDYEYIARVKEWANEQEKNI